MISCPPPLFVANLCILKAPHPAIRPRLSEAFEGSQKEEKPRNQRLALLLLLTFTFRQAIAFKYVQLFVLFFIRILLYLISFCFFQFTLQL